MLFSLLMLTVQKNGKVDAFDIYHLFISIRKRFFLEKNIIAFTCNKDATTLQ